MKLNLQSLENLFGKFKIAQERFAFIQKEIAKIQEEIGDYLTDSEEWKDKNSGHLPAVGERVLTAEVKDGSELYRVVIYQTPDQLHKYWVKINPLPNA